ncbi:MAG: enoyl-CoA hydratase/isomerase family protein [Lautropia sp.]
MSAAENTIAVEIREHTAILRICRPRVRNALDDATRIAMVAALDAVNANPEIRALVVTGEGQAFCSGGDIHAMQERARAPASEVAFNGWSRQQRTHQAVAMLHSLPKTTIAAVNGAAAGLGADLAIACDFVIASPAATFAWSYVRRGLTPDGGGMYFLPRRIGLSRAKDLIFTGRTIAVEEAQALGIVDRTAEADDLIDEACNWAGDLSRYHGPALALTKSIMTRSFESGVEEIFSQGSQAQGICYTTREHQSAIAAFLAKRKA